MEGLTDGEDFAWRPLSPDDAELCVELWNACFEVDANYRMVEQEWVDELTGPDDDPAVDGVIAVRDDGKAIGLGFVQIPPGVTLWRASGFGVVHPDYRGRGIGSAVLAWRGRRATERLAEISDGVPRLLWENHYDHQADATALVLGAGYKPARHYIEMTQPLSVESIPQSIDVAFEIRRFDVGDSDAVRQTHNDSFADHFGSQPVTEDSWTRFYVGEFFRPDLSFVAWDGDRVAGYLLATCFPHDFEAVGRTEVWIDTLGTRPEFRKQGVASALIGACMEASANAGFAYATLGVDSASQTGANSLYESLGFQVERSSTSYSKDPFDVVA